MSLPILQVNLKLLWKICMKSKPIVEFTFCYLISPQIYAIIEVYETEKEIGYAY